MIKLTNAWEIHGAEFLFTTSIDLIITIVYYFNGRRFKCFYNKS